MIVRRRVRGNSPFFISMKHVRNFFWFCSGASFGMLKRSPSESSKFVGIGGTVFFTGIFAALAGAYAIYTVFDNYFIAAGFGLLWGAMIFNLDRYIVSSMYTSKKVNPWLMAAPRLVLALLIAMVISKPLELKIFDKEITQEIFLMQEKLKQEKINILRTQYDSDIEQLSAEITSLKQEIDEKTASRNELMRIAQQEADGTGGTMKRNPGPIYRIKKADLERVEAELENLKKENLPAIRNRESRITELRTQLDQDIQNLSETVLTGLASRLQALDNLSSKNSSINLANWFIMILFIAIESAPVLVKLLAPSGPYDDLLAVHEHSFSVYRKEKIEVAERNYERRMGFQEG